mmetsp:Transcript_3103/g.6358  ORF Transcript_3103/g.6358 Transcript_3103/m.6358 type:complete len:227 (-) Transcript_3103:991-1671(-)
MGRAFAPLGSSFAPAASSAAPIGKKTDGSSSSSSSSSSASHGWSSSSSYSSSSSSPSSSAASSSSESTQISLSLSISLLLLFSGSLPAFSITFRGTVCRKLFRRSIFSFTVSKAGDAFSSPSVTTTTRRFSLSSAEVTSPSSDGRSPRSLSHVLSRWQPVCISWMEEVGTLSTVRERTKALSFERSSTETIELRKPKNSWASMDVTKRPRLSPIRPSPPTLSLRAV